MKTYSVFTQLLTELNRFSKKNDNATVNYSDLVNINKVENRIITCYQSNCYSHNEYRILIDLCYQLKSDMREVVRINQEVKAIERKITRDRLKFA